jgi:N-acetyl-anhydromuramyl-L-alanine amidase AmpD
MPRAVGLKEFAAGHLIPGRPSIILSEDGKVATGRDGLNIEYKGKDSSPYGIDATKAKQKFIGLIIHHTGDDHDTDWYVDYQIKGDKVRKGHFGYHFFISPEGRVVQGAPLTKRTNQISPESSVRLKFRKEFQNTNTIGISCVGAGKTKPDRSEPTEKQKTAVYQMVFALCDLYSIPFDAVVGHGEIQSNRMAVEGLELAKTIRAWSSAEPAAPEA